jgi:hypothetical protein
MIMNKIHNPYRYILFLLLATSLIAAGVLNLTDPKIIHSHIGAGGISRGGIYSLSGALDQHDAGNPIKGGIYTLKSGFWSGDEASEIKVFLPMLVR